MSLLYEIEKNATNEKLPLSNKLDAVVKTYNDSCRRYTNVVSLLRTHNMIQCSICHLHKPSNYTSSNMHTCDDRRFE
jgi:hypothetical protein